MPVTEQMVEMAAKMYSARRELLFLLGEAKYRERMALERKVIKAKMVAMQTDSEIVAGTALSKKALADGQNGMAVLCILAAVLETIEPMPSKNGGQ